MTDILNHIIQLTGHYAFPAASTEAFVTAFHTISSNPKARALFDQQVMLYENDVMCSFEGAFSNIKKSAEICGVREETAYGLYLLCLTEHLHHLYMVRGLDDSWYDGVIEDLKVKNDECFLIKGSYGTFVSDWFYKFFELTRFAIGRLQFQPMFMPESNDYNGVLIEEGELSIGIHIPGGKSLNIDECINSLKIAYEVFVPYFSDGVVVFNCFSWLLAPNNKKLLNPESSIVKFGELFNIIPSQQLVDCDFWRIYGREDCSDTASLPRDNSLRKAYALCAERGEIPCAGLGIIRMKDGEIIK